MKSSTAVIAGMTLTMMTGVAVGVMGKKLVDDNQRMINRKAKKMAQAVENLADTTRYIFKS